MSGNDPDDYPDNHAWEKTWGKETRVCAHCQLQQFDNLYITPSGKVFYASQGIPYPCMGPEIAQTLKDGDPLFSDALPLGNGALTRAQTQLLHLLIEKGLSYCSAIQQGGYEDDECVEESKKQVKGVISDITKALTFWTDD